MTTTLMPLVLSLLSLSLAVPLVVPVARRAPQTDSLAAAHLASITTDTGAFAPGQTAFTRYVTPGWCRAAALQMRDVIRGSLAAQAILDTLDGDPLRDTVGTQAVTAVARRCGARFTVARTPLAELPVLLELAVLEQNDTLAQAVLVRQVAGAATSAARQALWLAALDLAVGATPARIVLARAIVAALDAHGPSVAGVQGHQALFQLWTLSADTARAQQEESHLLALVHALSASAAATPAVGAAVLQVYRARMARAFYGDPDALPLIARQAQVEPSLSPVLGAVVRQWPLPKVIATLAPVDTSETGDAVLGQPAPPMRAAFWYTSDGRLGTSDTVSRPPGTVSLIVLGQLDDTRCAEWNWQDCLTSMALRIRRWLAQYGGAGLAVTLVVQIQGGNTLFGKLIPAEEAQTFRWFIQDYWRLHVPVVVQVPSHRTLPAPDGRQEVAEDTPIAQLSAADGQDAVLGEVVLTGRDGRLLAVTSELVHSGAAAQRFEALLRWALRPLPPSAPSVAVPTRPVPPVRTARGTS